MEPNWAAEHLQVIRTLMERTAVYRRALAPVMLLTGVLGGLAAPCGWWLGLDAPRGFVLFWGAVSLVGCSAALLLVRRQAWQAAEPFWSPPMRRVAHAMMPPMLAGWVTVLLMLLPRWQDPLQAWWLPGVWMLLYGTAVHAAGFFMPRGIKWFGWLFILAGCGLLILLSCLGGVPSLRQGHWVMGGVFGGFHLAYGLYLYGTESRAPKA